MKLNHECIRSVLLYLENANYIVPDEDDTPSFQNIFIEEIYKALPNFSTVDIYYSLFNLYQAGFIKASQEILSGSVYHFCVSYITFSGHQFLDTIKNDTVWDRVKSVLSEKSLGLSIDLIQSLATSIISSML